MNKSHLIGALCASVFGFITMSSHAALVGRDLDGNLTTAEAYYDTDANLTWLVDANAGAGSAYDNGTITTDGKMTWDNANNWAASLDLDGVAGADGWRLPTSDGCSGICTGSEMGNLFYNVLGGTADTSIATTHNSNYDLFTNIQSDIYWSSTEWAPNTTAGAWDFYFHQGRQDYSGKSGAYYAWAVQSGSVGAATVPVPAAVWLFGSGLLGLIGIARRKPA
ncbi:MAG: DUF1566 domain-containing protein [Gammaproteobacteria bacterium]|nr:DUF1566 domain-containing protein [Gammaproteobacteria bacterium]